MPSSLQRLISCIIFGSFFFSVAYFSHMDTVFQYDTDEGFHLIASFLQAHGHVLYKEIRIDYWPFLNLLITALIKYISPSVYLVRLLILSFSTLLLWGLFKIIRITQNTFCALFTTGLLILSPYYLRLSVSIMPGLPAISLAVLSILCIVLYQNNYKKRYLLLSGGLFALALLTKFFVIVFLPGLIIELALTENKKPSDGKFAIHFLYPLALWLISLITLYLFVSLIVTTVDYSQIIQPTINIKTPRAFKDLQGLPILREWALQSYDIILLSLGGLIFLKENKRKFFILPTTSFIFGFFILIAHAPVWYHHQLLLSIPLYWMASFGMYALFDKEIWIGWKIKSMLNRIKDGVGIIFLSGIIMIVLIRMPLRYADTLQQMNAPSPQEYHHVLDLLKKYAGQTHLVVTDSPLFAYYAQLPVPPHLATVSWKLLKTKIWTSKDMINVIKKDRPEIVLFTRFRGLQHKIAPYLKNEYTLLYQWDNGGFIQLYILNKINL